MNKNDSIEVFKPALAEKQNAPLFESGVSAGFPSPAEDYIDKKLDLNEYLVLNPASTFFVRVEGDSMLGAGIHSGDILIVDRSVKVVDRKVIIAILNGELTVKRIRIVDGNVSLVPENENYSIIEIDENIEFEVWGVVTSVVHPV